MKKIYFNGDIVTLDNDNNVFEAIMIENDKIVALGTYDDVVKLKDEETELVDLDNKAVFPGFIDPHGHFSFQSILSQYLYVAPSPIGITHSIKTLVKQMKEALEQREESDAPFIAYGYDHEQFEELRQPTRDDLDLVSTEVPVFAIHASLHVGSFNTKAMELLGISETQENPAGGHYGRYEGTDIINGYAEESAIQLPLLNLLTPKPEEVPEMLKKGQELYAKSGVTTCQDGFTTNNEFGLIKVGVENGLIDLDVHCYPPCYYKLREENVLVTGAANLECGEAIEKSGKLHYSGFKLVLDGSPQARTAWMSKPYEVTNPSDDPNYVAYPFYEDDQEVTEALKYAIDRNAPVLVHCNGDASADQFLRCFVKAKEESQTNYTARAVMIHCQTVREDQIDIMAQHNIVPAMFPVHTYFWGDVHIKNFGRERANKISNQKYALSKGLLPTSHEDSPVLPPSTLLTVWTACNRKTRSGEILGEELRLSRYESLRAVTYNAAYQYSEEDIKGTLEIGKMSDIVIIDKNVLSCSDEDLFNAKVVETIKRGKTIYKA